MKIVNRTLTVIIVLSIITGLSCRKRELGSKHLIGKITEEGSDIPVVNAKIEFREFIYNKNSLREVYRTLQTVYADANGNYSIDFDWKDYANWYVLAISTSTCETKEEGYYISPSKKDNIKHDVSLTPYAILRIHIIGDKGNYVLRINPLPENYFWNQGDNKYLNLMIYGNKNNTLYYNIRTTSSITSGTTPYTFTYFVKAHETYNYTIEF